MPARTLCGWQCAVLDALLGSGVLDAADLEGLRVPQLAFVASTYVKTISAGEPFDAEAVVAKAHVLTDHQRRLGRPSSRSVTA